MDYKNNTMTDKEKIKEEIERRIKEGSSKNDISEGALALNSLLDFIDSLPEEHNEDLEEELHSWMKGNCDDNGFFNQLELARHFAEWQKQKDDKHIGDLQWEAYLKGEQETKQQMMKDAVEGIVGGHTDIPAFINLEIEHKPNVKVGDKVKIVVLKTE